MVKKLGIYVHWPFCKSLCPYCDFNSHEPSAALSAGSPGAGHLSAQTEARYLDALRAELIEHIAQIKLLIAIFSDLPST